MHLIYYIGDEENMATYSRIEEYDETEEWPQYIERMDHYFEANEIDDDDKKRSIFLSVIGAKTYKLLWSLIQPETPKSIDFCGRASNTF
jgi:hypothetical protein